MKAKGLMIGDWVYDTVLKCNTMVKILSLSGMRGDIHENVWDENTFEPIPITPEILEKNGFVKRYNYLWKYSDSSCSCIISFAPQIKIDGETLGTPPINVVLEGALFNINMTSDMSVHNLQHALRLCGIEKEIVL